MFNDKVSYEHEGIVQQVDLEEGDYAEVKQRREARPPVDPAPKQETITLHDYSGNEVPYPKTKGRSTFNRSNDAIQWAWWTWNPVTGCLRGCPYCYAREMATSSRFATIYPAGFTPLFHHDRLDAPKNQRVPSSPEPEAKRVFVCSMGDLFGEWVPREWIERVMAAIREGPGFEYLMLTKNPERYLEFDLPTNAWAGATVDSQSSAQARITDLSRVRQARVRWVSCELLLEPIRVDFRGIDWVIIGARSGTTQPDGTKIPGFAPPLPWVMDLIAQARQADCTVYLKANLLGKTSDQWPGMKLIQEAPRRPSSLDLVPSIESLFVPHEI